MQRIIIYLIMSSVLILSGCKASDISYVTTEGTEENMTEFEQVVEEHSDEKVPVYVCGAVNNPGVYYLDTSSIKDDAIVAAGGFSEDASTTAINLASGIVPGEQIYVPTISEEIEKDKQELSDGKIHLNRATKEELMTLPGIGESKAEAILLYREQVGGFQRLEDIMNIPGIKQGVYDKIKEYIVLD